MELSALNSWRNVRQWIMSSIKVFYNGYLWKFMKRDQSCSETTHDSRIMTRHLHTQLRQLVINVKNKTIILSQPPYSKDVALWLFLFVSKIEISAEGIKFSDCWWYHSKIIIELETSFKGSFSRTASRNGNSPGKSVWTGEMCALKGTNNL